MARTQAPDSESRRGQIVELAAQLFAERGFLGASISQIADACGMSKSAIYHYYPSKEDILYDVMHSHVEMLNVAAREALSRPAKPDQRLRDMTQKFMAAYTGAAARHKVLLNDLAHLPRARRAKIVALQRNLIVMVEGVLQDISPTLKSNSALRRASVMIYFGMINWTHIWFDPNGALNALEFAELAADIALSGLKSGRRRN